MQPLSSAVPKIRIVFMGTPSFAESILDELIINQYHIVAVYTRPDAAIGRNRNKTGSIVKQTALKYNLPVEQPVRFDEDSVQKLKSYRPDLIIVAAYGRILPKAVLEIPGFGCVNVHPSLLPKFRGPSPVQNAILAGENTTGTTLMLLDEGMDTGDILAQKTIDIDPDDVLPAVMRTLSALSASLLLETLPLWIERKIQPSKQDASQAILCQLIEREDGHILWTQDALSLYNTFRALYSWPGIYSFWNKDKKQLVRLKCIRITYQKQNPQIPHHLGEVFEVGEKVGVQTGQGIVFLEEVQLEGKVSMPIREFIKGYPAFLGSVLQ